MEMNEDHTGEKSAELERNIARIESLTRRLVDVLSRKKPGNPAISGPDRDLFTRAATAYWHEMIHHPARILEHQAQYWGKTLTHFLEAQSTFARGRMEAPEDHAPDDPRFENPLWKTNPFFNYIKQQYLINAEAISQAVDDIEDMDETEKRRLRYFSRQIVDMMAPTNFLATNPDALQKAIDTEGDSLVKGLENLVSDLEANDGELVIRLADDTAFRIGDNIAASPGKVVYRNRMMELIQFSPTTDTVHKTPVVLFPPWINKYYILDLKPRKSLIKWIVDQGYTLFVASWINPDPSFRDVGMDDYIEDGFLRAISEAKSICGTAQVNTVGYCIAGTTLHISLALLRKRGDRSVRSATFLTSLTDFSDQGEFTPFLQNDFVDGIEKEVAQQGILRAFIMGRTMSFLRSTDLIYRPAIRNYMMGETPPAFDLLFWNGDGSGLPGRMVMEYLRDLCQRNSFTDGGFRVLGETVSIRDVTLPICSIATESDHIARWTDVYRGFRMTRSRTRKFILGKSGHIAGIVNPPEAGKYGYYTNDALPNTAEAWKEDAIFHEGSWWPEWENWLRPRSGKRVEARAPGSAERPPLEDAPGRYVLAKAHV